MLLIVDLAHFDDRLVIPTSSLYYESQLRPSDDSCDVVYSCRFCFNPGTQTFPEQIFAYRPNILGVLIETLSMFAPSGRNPYLTLVMYSVVHLLKFSVDAYVAEFQ